jgi:hypothetical protein
MRTYRLLLCAVLFVSSLAGQVRAADNELTEQEKKDGWQLLFNGRDHTGWKCNNGKPIATPVEDGSLVPYKSGGYIIIHEKQFGDFILKCDVKWDAPQCNSGIFFRVAKPADPVNTGFEVQVMSGKGTGLHDFGAIYDLATTTKNAGKETGEWNAIEIKCQGPHLSVKVNGEQVCQLNCDEFDKPGQRLDGTTHKFKQNGQPVAVKDFARTGYLGFQDHGQKVWYKNVKLLELKN